MRMIRRSVLLALGAACAAAASMPAAARKAEHPLIGIWTWQPEGKDCKEVYEWRADHTGHVTSGEEVTETRFQVSKTPDANGYYVFIDTIVKDNRGRDCAGSKKDDTGSRNTLYIQIHPSGNLIRICSKPEESACFGPLMRLPEVEI
ncbi:MAG: hypothetical protein NVS9B10_25680 [Nevskia sp.]